ncbi:thioredoxin domain-containing protein [Candidatus Uhrbacteria bacterium]|nr:thioredoxin domain-containing protein [Candidatus Uhrbacteria bacterium]
MGKEGFSFDTLFAGTQAAQSSEANEPATAPPNPSNDRPASPPPAENPAPPSGGVPVVTDNDHARGDRNAPITLIEYSDLECPFCRQFHPTMKQILEAYPGEVRWVYRHFPLSFHANAQKEAEATECAAELGGNGAFWAYTDAIFDRTTSNGQGFPLANLVPLAKELGLNEQKFKDCLDSDKYASYVRDQMAAGASAGITGTPGTFVVDAAGNSQLIPGALPFESVKQVVDSLL